MSLRDLIGQRRASKPEWIADKLKPTEFSSAEDIPCGSIARKVSRGGVTSYIVIGTGIQGITILVDDPAE